VVFRADAVFAEPEIYEALEGRGVKRAIRIPQKQPQQGIAALLPRPMGRQATNSVSGTELSCRGRQLESGCTIKRVRRGLRVAASAVSTPVVLLLVRESCPSRRGQAVTFFAAYHSENEGGSAK